jgi:hypothetical protein
VLVGAVLGLILVRTTGKPIFGWLIEWDILLPVVVYFGQRRTLPEGLILTLFCSHLYSLSSAAPIGVFTSYYLAIFIVARLVSYVMYASTWISILLLIFSLTVLSRFAMTGVASAFGHGWPVFAPGNLSFLQMFRGSVMGYVVYQMLGVLDLMTYKTAASNIELAESEL